MPLKKKTVEELRMENDLRYQEYSKESLKEHVKKKFKTSMIGSIATLEDSFGHLWGHGLREDELTEDEFRMREIWENVRSEILDKCNSQCRGALAEISNYTVSYNKHKYEFKVMSQNKGLTYND